MSFRTALTGLNAANADLGVISNNIANNNSTGFKASRAEFADLYTSDPLRSTASGMPGSGVKLAAVSQQFKQGSITSTGNPLDLAIDGGGFFRLSDNGSVSYTRAGSFGVDREGFLVNNRGMRLTGFQSDAAGGVTQTLGDLKLATGALSPRITTEAQYGLNLDAEAPAIDTATFPFDPANPDSYNFTTSVTVFDSLGASHTLSSYFVKPDAAANDWEVHFTLDGGVPFDTTATPPTPTTYGPQPLSFDNAGILTGTGVINLTGVVTGNAAANLDLTLDFSETTQFGGQFATNSLVQDGYSSGRLTGMDVGEDGTLFGRYSNGQSQVLGQLALVNFQNTQGLRPVGDTAWVETFASGAPLLGAPGTGSLGVVRSGTLESSTVELTEELVNMINAQRNFQANAQVISTADSLTQTIINLR